MVTIYEKDSGKAVIFAHAIDAKESLATGFYTAEGPNKVEAVLDAVTHEIPVLKEPESIVIPEPTVRRSTAKPIVKKIVKK